MKRVFMMLLSVVTLSLFAGIRVSNVKVLSGYPWQEVVIGYTITGMAEDLACLQISVKDSVDDETYECKNVEGLSLAEGNHVVKWNASKDGAKFKSNDVQVTVKIGKPLYYVVDLSCGASATSYPVTGLINIPKSGWTDEYKTTKLVLRRIEPGTFMMGRRSTDYPGAQDSGVHEVTLTRPYYIGVFEVTQLQWELVMGIRPRRSYSREYERRPVQFVSYDMIRGSSAGAGWPVSSDVDKTSFLGVLRTKTGLDFDLPTEAQWEYACRAGTTTALNNGKNLSSKEQDGKIAEVGRYGYNSGYLPNGAHSGSPAPSEATAIVGSYVPNSWGLYDMHGNVYEWCLDWYDSLSTDSLLNPMGPLSSPYNQRVVRGGGWTTNADSCTSSYRGCCDASDEGYYSGCGFRLVRNLPN